MIGLGSNRLTVCRRGGMRVTQAGRGGMEWLGVRMPSWASPYSAQATAALLAQFPTQWPTIRDYGFAHPEIVGYMNAYAPEDAKIAYSLVAGLGVRYMKGDGNSWIDTGIKPRNTTRLHILRAYWGDDTVFTDYDKNAGISYTDNGSTGSQGWGFNLWGTSLYVGFGNYTSPGSVSKNKIYEFDMNKGAWSVKEDGVSKWSGTMSGSPTPSYNLLLFGWMRNGNVPYRSKMYKDRAQMYENDVMVRDFVPFISRTQGMGMMDLVNGVFHPNMGTGQFTELIETPAS